MKIITAKGMCKAGDIKKNKNWMHDTLTELTVA